MTKLSAEKLKAIKAELLNHGFKYRQSNGIHQFLNAAILQGIELNGHNINPFCIGNESERVYGYDNVGNEVRDMIPLIEDILMDPANEPQDEDKAHESQVIPPDTPNPPEKIPDQVGDAELIQLPTNKEMELAGPVFGIVPKYLTDELIAKHPGTISALISMQKTAAMHIQEREKSMKYVDVSYMTTALNFATLMDWSFESVETTVDDVEEYDSKKKKNVIKKHISVLGRLTVHTTEGKEIIKEQWGSQVLKYKMEMGDARKAAASDALKKCASMLGIAADVYGGVYND